jgi:hypothetical protein
MITHQEYWNVFDRYMGQVKQIEAGKTCRHCLFVVGCNECLRAEEARQALPTLPPRPADLPVRKVPRRAF